MKELTENITKGKIKTSISLDANVYAKIEEIVGSQNLRGVSTLINEILKDYIKRKKI